MTAHQLRSRNWFGRSDPEGFCPSRDFFYAGGLPAVLRELLPLLHGEALTKTSSVLSRYRRPGRAAP